MRSLRALQYLAALVVYLYRCENFYAKQHSDAPNYQRAFGVAPYRSEIFDADVDYFEKDWNPKTRGAESFIAFRLKRFTEAGV